MHGYVHSSTVVCSQTACDCRCVRVLPPDLRVATSSTAERAGACCQRAALLPSESSTFLLPLGALVGYPSLFAISNRKMQNLPLFSCILIRNEGKSDQGVPVTRPVGVHALCVLPRSAGLSCCHQIRDPLPPNKGSL